MTFFQSVLEYFRDFSFQLFVAELIYCMSLKRRKYFPVRFIFFAVVMCVIPFAFDIYAFPFFSIGWMNCSFFIVYFISIFLIRLCFDVSLLNAVFLSTAAYATQHCAHSAALVLISLILPGSDIMSFIRISSLIIVYTAFYFIFARRISRYEYDVKFDNIKVILLSVIIILIVNVLNLWASEVNGQQNAIVRIYAALICIFMLSVQFGMFEQSRLEKEKQDIERIIELQGKQQQISKDATETINILCHDLKKSLLKIYSLDQTEKERAVLLKQTIENYEENAKTGNEMLDVVLTENIFRCKKYHIQFSYMVDGEKLSFMEPYDVYAVFTNVLNNAMESVIKTEDESKRIVSLRISEKDGFLCIYIENYCSEDIEFADGLPVSTKEDKRFHGFGVRSIKYVVDKYKGNLIMGKEDNMFFVKIIFILKDNK